MTKGLIFAAAAAVLVLSSTTASAVSCKQRAANCVKNGGSHAACYHSYRLDQCERTGIYTGVSGVTWPATVTKTRNKK